MKTIICAADGSDHGEIALSVAADLARATGAALHAVVVNVTYGRSPRGPSASIWTDAEAQDIVGKVRASLAELSMPSAEVSLVTSREASSAIIDHAERLDADAIVVGTGDKRGLARLVIGSVAADVANRAPCTVIVAR